MQVLPRQAVPGLGNARHRALNAPSWKPVPMRPSVARRFKERDETEEELMEAQRRMEQQLRSASREAKSAFQQVVEPVELDSQFKVAPLTPVFSRRREVFVGRLAIIGIVAAGFWEYWLPNHPNILQQVSGVFNLVGLPVGPGTALAFIMSIVVFNALAGMAPGSPSWSEDNFRDVQKRPSGPPTDWTPNFQQIFGISGWGFSKKNELFNGRLAMLGFAAALIQQMRWGGLAGPGPLAQVAIWLGRSPDDTFYSNVPLVVLSFAVFAGVLAYLLGNTGAKARYEEKDIY